MGGKHLKAQLLYSRETSKETRPNWQNVYQVPEQGSAERANKSLANVLEAKTPRHRSWPKGREANNHNITNYSRQKIQQKL